MKAINIISISAALMLLSPSCVETKIETVFASVELTAMMECDAETKTALSGLENGMYYPLWSAEDKIAVFADDCSDPSEFILTEGEGSTVARFSGLGDGSRYRAIYPYGIAGLMKDGYMSLTLPQKQEYVPDSFGQGAFPMIASGDSDGILRFMNLCSILKITLTGKAAIRSVTVTANDDDTYLAGSAKINGEYDSEPSLVMDEVGSHSVVLECNGLFLSESEPTELYVVIPAQTYVGGFTVSIDTYKEIITRKIDADVVFKRSQIRNLEISGIDSPSDEKSILLAKERDALIEMYHSLGGDNWTNNENWCSDRPVGEWYGVDTDSDGFVWQIYIDNNNLSGSLPSSISNLTKLLYLTISSNPGMEENGFPLFVTEMETLRQLNLSGINMIGEIPDEVYEMTHLEELVLCGNNLIGHISENIGNMTGLSSINLSHNRLTGQIPERITSLPHLRTINLMYNALSGDIPKALLDHSIWKTNWHTIVLQNGGIGGGFNRESIEILLPDFSTQAIDGSHISDEMFRESKYTIVYHFLNMYASSDWHISGMVSLYETYKDKGLQIYSPCYHNYDQVKSYVDMYKILWPCSVEQEYGAGPFSPYLFFTPCVGVYDSTGRLVFGDYLGDFYEDIFSFIDSKFGAETDPEYDSTDFSEDGIVHKLQSATKGNGINVVLMGDGYSDRLIASGAYKADMEYAYDNLFTVEPYKSYKDLFNVSYVNVVSSSEGYGTGKSTALGCKFDGGTHVSGNDDVCFQYALKAVSEEQMDETLIVVVMNSYAYAGTCYMYYPDNANTDYGSGSAIAYFPKGSYASVFAQVLHHEASGHGFAKLQDEYAYEYMGAVTSEQADDIRYWQENYGWWKNVDFTSDPEKVRWSYFLEDARYANEGLGVFEGGMTYWTGVWRPTETSIMVNNAGEFNAPSREAIYYRIHKLAYGDSWEYDYEKFVEYDAVNRTSASADAPQKRRANYVEKSYEPLAPPVIVGKTWKEAQK